MHQDAQFFEANSTGARDVVHHERSRKDPGGDCRIFWPIWLRQSFTAVALLFVVLHTDWKLALVSLTVLPFVLVPTPRLGRRIRRTTRQRAGRRRRAQPGPAGNAQRPSGGEVLRRRGDRIEPFPRPRRTAAAQQSALRAQQAIASPLIEFFGAITIVGLLDLRAHADQSRRDDRRRLHQLRDRAADAVRAREAAHRHPQHLSAGAGRIAESVRVPGSRPADHRTGRARPSSRASRSRFVFDNVSFRYPSAPKDSCWTTSIWK